MVNSIESPTYPFMRDVWDYLKRLYIGLGDEAENIIKSIEANCNLLMEDYSPTDLEHIIDSECSIRLFTDGNKTLFDQCAEWIGHDSISTITIMSPFYDRNGSLIKALYNKYRPGEIRVIYEDDFGTHPKTSDISGYTKFYKW